MRWNRIAIGDVDTGVTRTSGPERTRESMPDPEVDPVHDRFQRFYNEHFAADLRWFRNDHHATRQAIHNPHNRQAIQISPRFLCRHRSVCAPWAGRCEPA